jgi:hypothetical protein
MGMCLRLVRTHIRHKDARAICTGDYETILRRTKAFSKINKTVESPASGCNWDDVLDQTLDGIWRLEAPDQERPFGWTPKLWLVFTKYFMGQEDEVKRIRSLVPNPKPPPKPKPDAGGSGGRAGQREKNAGIKYETGQWTRPDARAEAAQVSAVQQHFQVSLQQAAAEMAFRKQRVDELKLCMELDADNAQTYKAEILKILQTPAKSAGDVSIAGAAESLASGVEKFRHIKRARVAVDALGAVAASSAQVID